MVLSHYMLSPGGKKRCTCWATGPFNYALWDYRAREEGTLCARPVTCNCFELSSCRGAFMCCASPSRVASWMFTHFLNVIFYFLMVTWFDLIPVAPSQPRATQEGGKDSQTPCVLKCTWPKSKHRCTWSQKYISSQMQSHTEARSAVFKQTLVGMWSVSQ